MTRYFIDRNGHSSYFLDENLVLRSFQIQQAGSYTALSSFIKHVNSAEMAAIVLSCQEVSSHHFCCWMDSFWNLQCSFFDLQSQHSLK